MSLSENSFAFVGLELGRILPVSRRRHTEDQATRRPAQDVLLSDDASGDDLDASLSALTWADTIDLSKLCP